MYHLKDVPTKSSFYFTLSLLQFLCEMDCRADDALSFLMNLNRNVNLKSGLNKIQPQTHLQVTWLFSGVLFSGVHVCDFDVFFVLYTPLLMYIIHAL